MGRTISTNDYNQSDSIKKSAMIDIFSYHKIALFIFMLNDIGILRHIHQIKIYAIMTDLLQSK
jgi:hypothetical protein